MKTVYIPDHIKYHLNQTCTGASTLRGLDFLDLPHEPGFNYAANTYLLALRIIHDLLDKIAELEEGVT